MCVHDTMSTMNNVLFYSPKNAFFPHDARFMFSSPIQLHHDRVTSTRQHAHVSLFSLSNTHTHLSNDVRVPIFPTSCSSLDAFHFYLNLFQYTSPSHTTKHTHTHTHTHTHKHTLTSLSGSFPLSTPRAAAAPSTRETTAIASLSVAGF